MLLLPVVIPLLLSYARAIASHDHLRARADCSNSYTDCAPTGATTTIEPPVGTGLASFYVDIVDSVSAVNKQRRDVLEPFEDLFKRASGGVLCCADGTQCLLLQDYNLPFCYDNYTTNYFLPGGAYGQIVSGNYTSPDGSEANLISGNYTLAGGMRGNVYGSPASGPDTSTLPIPTQYTASGSGSVIPATALGQYITYVTTIPGTLIPPSVIPATTIAPDVVSGSTISAAITEAATTIPGTTVAAKVSTVTTRLAGAATTRKSQGSSVRIESQSHGKGNRTQLLLALVGLGLWYGV